MQALSFLLLLTAGFASANLHRTKRYEPTWESIDSRPLPSWYDEAKFGIFIHWGVFSVPSFGSEWFWNRWQGNYTDYVKFMNKNFKPNFTYPDFGPMFTAEFFNPDFWADLLQASGAKYIVLTSKHHEGFTLWPSKFSWNWNAMDVGPKRDLVGDLASSIRRRTNLHFGLYHSLFEWFHPLYLQDQANNFKTRLFPESKTLPELYELVYKYRPEVIWSDGDAGPDTYWNSTGFLAWLYNDSPIKDIVVTNDRWGNGISCHHGGYFTCYDRYNPGSLQNHKWENCMTIDKKSWGFRREAVLQDFLSIHDLLQTLAETVSCGGNLLMNVGPTHDGRIAPIFEERLRQMGQWLKVNGEAIYSSTPWLHQNDTVTKGIWYTSKPRDKESPVYAIVLQWPDNNVLYLNDPMPSANTRINLLGYNQPLRWKAAQKGIQVIFPVLSADQLSSQWTWVLKMSNLQNRK